MQTIIINNHLILRHTNIFFSIE